MSVIRMLLEEKNQTIDYNEIREKYPFITKKNMKCILSPDSDGLLCGLFMSHFMGWKIIGFYDGKVLVMDKECSVYDEDVVFLDIEIYREGIKSVGHHMLSLNNKWLPLDWNEKFSGCLQPNLLRKYDGKKHFRLKYPLATIHLIISILEGIVDIPEKDTAIFPLLFTDGTYNVMFSYPENVMNWWGYLNVKENSKYLSNVFYRGDYTIIRLMEDMDKFFKERDEITAAKERGDRMKISNKDSTFHNISIDDETGLYFIKDDAANRCKLFLTLLEKHTGWSFINDSWQFDKFKLTQFTKSDFISRNWTLKKENWEKFLAINPVSWAMTSGDNIEFTIEEPDKLT